MDRYKKANKASLFGIAGNIFLLIIKLIIGIITNSQAMLSDALNSAGDIISSFITFIGNKIASKGTDENYNLGHGKAEYIFSLLISIFMILCSAGILLSSIKSIFIPYNYKFNIFLLVVCIITIMVKMMLYLYTNNIAKKYNNLLVEANAKDHRNDCVLTTLNLVASIFGMFGITLVDGVVGSLVAIWIILVGFELFKKSYEVLMDKGISKELKKRIIKIIKKYPEIKRINHFNSTPIGYQFQLSITIFVDGNLPTYVSHDIANRLEKEITSLDEIYVAIIHVNPIKINKRKR